jgi:hypothetical protein
MSQPIDAVQMTRRIRDEMTREMRGMTRDEQRAYIERRAAEMQRQVDEILRARREDGGKMGFKEKAHALIDALPDDATWDDLLREIHVHRSIEAGQADGVAGRVTAVEDLRESFGLPR